MGKKKREPLPYHKQTLGDQIEDPESYGVRVRCQSLCIVFLLLAPAQQARLRSSFMRCRQSPGRKREEKEKTAVMQRTMRWGGMPGCHKAWEGPRALDLGILGGVASTCILRPGFSLCISLS